jgi:hypothetical protein
VHIPLKRKKNYILGYNKDSASLARQMKYNIIEIKEQVRITVGIACGVIAAGADYKKIAEACTSDLMKVLAPIIKDANKNDD